MRGGFPQHLKIVSTGTDVAAQVAAIDNFVNSGFDAILTIAVNPTAFGPAQYPRRTAVKYGGTSIVIEAFPPTMANSPIRTN